MDDKRWRDDYRRFFGGQGGKHLLNVLDDAIKTADTKAMAEQSDPVKALALLQNKKAVLTIRKHILDNLVQ